MQDIKQFHSWVRWLRREFPSRIKVYVRLVPKSWLPKGWLAGLFYEPHEGDTYASIYVWKRLNEQQTLEYLFDEWSHLLRQHLSQIDNAYAHDDIFWAIFSRIHWAWYKDVK